MNEQIPANTQALFEAHSLSDVILKDIELGQLPLTNIALKTARLARLLNEFDYQKIMQYEAGGYPITPSGVAPSVWRLAKIAQRTYNKKDVKTNSNIEVAYLESIEQLVEEVQSAKQGIEAARDRNISISSANPSQYVWAPSSNTMERRSLQSTISLNAKRLSERRSFIYEYVLHKHHELKFSGIADDLFSRLREEVDSSIGKVASASVQKFNAIYENLSTDNPENWANAVHSCRRILEEIANTLFPPCNDRIKEGNGSKRTIKLGPGNYKNRLICYVEDMSDSDRFKEIVGSHLSFLADRLDSVFQAAQKGTHGNIVSKREADRYVIYTYMIIGDILSI